MEKQKFRVILSIIVPHVVYIISKEFGCSEIQATEMFYGSSVYSFLEREETSYWHYSPMLLYTLFDEEYRTGTFEDPEEAF